MKTLPPADVVLATAVPEVLVKLIAAMNLPDLVFKTSATLLGVATLVLGADMVHAMTNEAIYGKTPVRSIAPSRLITSHAFTVREALGTCVSCV